MTKFEQILSNPNVNGNKVIKGYIFVVPNKASKISRDTDYAKENFEIYKKEFGDVVTEDNMVQIWAHNAPEEGQQSNWSDHGVPTEVLEKAGIPNFQCGFWRDGLFHSYLPASWLKDKKEGEHLYLSYENGTEKAYFDLVCQQQNYRYEQFGNFEDVVERVL